MGSKWEVRAFDLAFTEKQTQKHDPDFTATGLGCRANECLYLGDPELYRVDVDDVGPRIAAKKMVEPGIRFGMGKIAIKSKVVRYLNNAGFAIEQYEEETDKVSRASAFINWAKTGRVKLVGTEDDWKPFMAQWTGFPFGHDDAVDWASGITEMLQLTIFTPAPPPPKKRPYAFLD